MDGDGHAAWLDCDDAGATCAEGCADLKDIAKGGAPDSTEDSGAQVSNGFPYPAPSLGGDKRGCATADMRSDVGVGVVGVGVVGVGVVGVGRIYTGFDAALRATSAEECCHLEPGAEGFQPHL